MSCPYKLNKQKIKKQQEWWPNQLNLSILQDTKTKDNPEKDLNYITNIQTVNINELKSDIIKALKTSTKWWKADYNHYGPLMIRLAWHSAGTYRILDGRGGGAQGSIRFAPLNSWPDNANLDKARRILWSVKKKYGCKLSWSDLILFAGNVALEDMGFETLGFGFGRRDVFAKPEEDVYWGSETTWLDSDRGREEGLEKPLGATQMGLIYVNPEGPGGIPDPLLAAKDIRETFYRMSMNDEETVALIAGGHTFGKAHGTASPDTYVGREPEGAPLEEQGLGWKNTFQSGHGKDAITSGLEGAWTTNPIQWDNGYFHNLFRYEWKQTKSPAGATQWIPTNYNGELVPDAHHEDTKHMPIMFTTDLALRYDPKYHIISKRFHEHPDEFRLAFAKAWYKLTHRDMGPISRLYGPLLPPPQIWQDPIPNRTHILIDTSDVTTIKQNILKTDLTLSQLVRTAWSSASTYRCTDHRGGANGARIALEPQKSWHVNNIQSNELDHVLSTFKSIQLDFNTRSERRYDGKYISLADLIIIGGSVGIEQASNRIVPTSLGRMDASQIQTDVESIQYLEPKFDAFRNYISPNVATTSASDGVPIEYEMLLDRAYMLRLTPSEMTVLIGGLRVLNANANESSQCGVFTTDSSKLTNDFFVNLLDMDTIWKKHNGVYVGTCRDSSNIKWKATSIDLLFGSHSELRSVVEYYACDGMMDVFVDDFIKAWCKVMDLDRFDLRRGYGDFNEHLRSKL